ncbi:hemocyte protein-glutamine gamma-glutamyltransferase-like [Leptopilina heterotoma]|uniref:hemocyte protein-glutamine gamma-glutamyltransferase-like n=1 Tax=Leptopilina heterotoma TaxID=63436 RepID=UPI001CA7C7E5|nr:hemocyte protein-glutamine gamma-glutamyltransferase-like [Leptopilina heterotoma]
MDEPLVVETIYMYEAENARTHHTDNFELVHFDPPSAVLRRGQTFNIALRFNRDYIDETDIVRLLFSFGPNPSVMRGTRGIGTVNSDNHLKNIEAWGVRMLGANGTDISVEVRSPVDSPVGIWQLNVETTIVGRGKPVNTHPHDADIYLLFNPWIKEDNVYFEDQQLLHEYVLNDVGKIWVGPYGSARGREWIFGQFDAAVLPACQLLLERSGIKTISRGDPIKMTRAISRIINSNDDKGVIEGRWDGEYEDGTAPSAWTGSVPILEEFLSTEKEVKYGQCWVFAGVVTTVCRALGIPSRVVTNLVSAHDTNATLSVDRYYSMENEELDYDPNNPMGNMDSIWNYHVWNDVWMARPDLPKGYGGWQAIDATPQETSEGLYQCGPASVEAVRSGVVGYNYDIQFLVASVNADLMRWKEDPRSEFGYSKIESNKYHIGRMILTKAPWVFDPNGDTDKEDITYLYKAREGTPAERLTLYRAVRSVDLAKRFYSFPAPGKEDVVFDLVDLMRVNIGDPFTVTVNIENKSNEVRTIKAILSAGSVYYTGIKANIVKRASGSFALQPHSHEQLKLTVTVDEYLEKLVEYCIMKLYAIASVEETRQTWADEDDFQVLKPSIDVKIEGELVVGKASIITLSFKNPLKKVLTNSKFQYAGPGLSKNKTIEYRDVAPEENIYVEHELVPQKSGPQKIVATFTSKQLVDITGSISVDVEE